MPNNNRTQEPLVSHGFERRPCDSLRPNPYNSALFPDSLSDASIAVIAADLERNGQRHPIEITPEGVIVDGERRWHAARRLGLDEIGVIEGPPLSDEEIQDRVLDACTSSRQMTLREQANVYNAVYAQLQRDEGRARGRPKTCSNEHVFLAPKQMRATAAKRAGFSSVAMARRVSVICRSGWEDLQRQVCEGTISVYAAYETLRRRRTAPEPDDAADESPAGVESGAGPASDGPSAEPSGVRRRPQVRMASGCVTASAQPGVTRPVDQAGDDLAPIDDEARPEQHVEAVDLAGRLVPCNDLVDRQSAERHLKLFCDWLIAAKDYDEATSWFKRAVREMKDSLKVRPDYEDDNPYDPLPY